MAIPPLNLALSASSSSSLNTARSFDTGASSGITAPARAGVAVSDNTILYLAIAAVIGVALYFFRRK